MGDAWRVQAYTQVFSEAHASIILAMRSPISAEVLDLILQYTPPHHTPALRVCSKAHKSAVERISWTLDGLRYIIGAFEEKEAELNELSDGATAPFTFHFYDLPRFHILGD